MEIKQCRDFGDATRTHIHGLKKIREQSRSWNSGEEEVARTYHLDGIHQRMRHIDVDHNQQTTCSVDECLFLPLGYAHHVEKMYHLKEKLTISRGRTCKWWQETSMPNWDQGVELNVSVLERIQRGKQMRRLDEAMADDTKFVSSLHVVQKNK